MVFLILRRYISITQSKSLFNEEKRSSLFHNKTVLGVGFFFVGGSPNSVPFFMVNAHWMFLRTFWTILGAEKRYLLWPSICSGSSLFASIVGSTWTDAGQNALFLCGGGVWYTAYTHSNRAHSLSCFPTEWQSAWAAVNIPSHSQAHLNATPQASKSAAKATGLNCKRKDFKQICKLASSPVWRSQ